MCFCHANFMDINIFIFMKYNRQRDSSYANLIYFVYQIHVQFFLLQSFCDSRRNSSLTSWAELTRLFFLDMCQI